MRNTLVGWIIICISFSLHERVSLHEHVCECGRREDAHDLGGDRRQLLQAPGEDPVHRLLVHGGVRAPITSGARRTPNCDTNFGRGTSFSSAPDEDLSVLIKQFPTRKVGLSFKTPAGGRRMESHEIKPSACYSPAFPRTRPAKRGHDGRNCTVRVRGVFLSSGQGPKRGSIR